MREKVRHTGWTSRLARWFDAQAIRVVKAIFQQSFSEHVSASACRHMRWTLPLDQDVLVKHHEISDAGSEDLTRQFLVHGLTLACYLGDS